MFVKRALVTFTLAPLALWLIYLGGWYYFAAILLMMVVATAEYANFIDHLGWRAPRWLMVPIVSLLLIDAQWPDIRMGGMVLTYAGLASMVYALWRYERQNSSTATADLLATVGGIFIIGWLGSHFLRLRHLDDLGHWTMLVFVCVAAADTFAYLVGSQLGRHQLTPRLSPKKSIEGYVGGIVGGTLFGLAFTYWFLPDISLWTTVWLGGLLTAVSPAGDLGFSMLKREAGVKDSGNVFPGHGGVLDRFDSLLWSVALAYYLILYFLI